MYKIIYYVGVLILLIWKLQFEFSTISDPSLTFTEFVVFHGVGTMPMGIVHCAFLMQLRFPERLWSLLIQHILWEV